MNDLINVLMINVLLDMHLAIHPFLNDMDRGLVLLFLHNHNYPTQFCDYNLDIKNNHIYDRQIHMLSNHFQLYYIFYIDQIFLFELKNALNLKHILVLYLNQIEIVMNYSQNINNHF